MHAWKRSEAQARSAKKKEKLMEQEQKKGKKLNLDFNGISVNDQ